MTQESTLQEPSPKTPARSKKNPWFDLLVNIIIPSIILMKLSTPERLGPARGLLVALAFPAGAFLIELYKERKASFIAVLGFVSIMLTGGIGLLALDPFWIAIKEASVPLIIGCVVLGSMKTKYPLVHKLIYNDAILNTPKVANALRERNQENAFERLLLKTSYLLAGSFFLSAVLNYVLAKVIVVTSPSLDQVKFNEEIGRMAVLSYPVIVVPSMIMLGVTLWILVRGIKKLTGLELDDIFHGNEAKPQ